MTIVVPETGAAFENLMAEIDADFARDEVPIPARPLRAVMMVGRRFKISIPLAPLPRHAPAEMHRYAPLALNIKDWYDRAYGERIKLDFSPGSTAVEIEGDLYILKFPWVLGSVSFSMSRHFAPVSRHFTNGPSTCNVLQLIQNLTPAKAATLSDEALRKIWDSFLIGMAATNILESNRQHALMDIARGDIRTAVDKIFDRGNRYGDSKWASLQASEKILKATIALEGAQFKHTHKLSDLCVQLEELGLKFSWKQTEEHIQCAAGVRYGEVSCTRQDALRAHHACFALVVTLAKAGAKYQPRSLALAEAVHIP